MFNFSVQQSQHNHYIKKTILKKWLINDKYHYLDIADNQIKELGKR